MDNTNNPTNPTNKYDIYDSLIGIAGSIPNLNECLNHLVQDFKVLDGNPIIYENGYYHDDEENEIFGIYIYKNKNPDCWVYVTYGLSDPVIWKDRTDIAGFGLELVMRIPREKGTKPPLWPMDMLVNISNGVFKYDNLVETGQIKEYYIRETYLGDETKKILVTLDSALGKVQTHEGLINFMNVFEVKDDEYRLMQEWKKEPVAEIFREKFSKLLINDPDRKSILEGESGQELLARAENEPCEQEGIIFDEGVAFEVSEDRVTLSFPLEDFDSVYLGFKKRLKFDKSYFIALPEKELTFTMLPPYSHLNKENKYFVYLSMQVLNDILGALKPEKGKYIIKPDIEINVL